MIGEDFSAVTQINYAPSSAHYGWRNPFTGEFEQWTSSTAAYWRMFESAAQRISELQAEVDEIRAQLSLTKPTTGK